jgi:hypothetical protein
MLLMMERGRCCGIRRGIIIIITTSGSGSACRSVARCGEGTRLIMITHGKVMFVGI